MRSIYSLVLILLLYGCHSKSNRTDTIYPDSIFVIDKAVLEHIQNYNHASYFHTKDSVYALSFFSNKNLWPIAPRVQKAMYTDTVIIISQFTIEESKFKGYRGVLSIQGLTILVFDEKNLGWRFYNKQRLKNSSLLKFKPINTENHCCFSMSVVQGHAIPRERR
jgi:hypothetical protein